MIIFYRGMKCHKNDEAPALQRDRGQTRPYSTGTQPRFLDGEPGPSQEEVTVRTVAAKSIKGTK